MTRAMPVYYTPWMVAESGGFSPSAAKPAKVMADWTARGLAVDVGDPLLATHEQLYRAHDRRHVDQLLAGKKHNGHGNRSKELAETLRLTTGAMLSAARRALADGRSVGWGVACAPVSGFHHAMWDQVQGFCTLNGLMVAAMALLREDGVDKVGVLDYDQHYGNGTDQIAQVLRLKKTEFRHVTAGRYYRTRGDAAELLSDLPGVVRSFQDCDVVLYQAGADQCVDDPLGGVLTTAQLKLRDRTVLRGLRDLGVPVAWNLAGGYQVEKDGSIPKVLKIHENTARVAIATLNGQ